MISSSRPGGDASRIDGKALPAYEPGAHIDLHLPNGLIRQYSLVFANDRVMICCAGCKSDRLVIDLSDTQPALSCITADC